MGKTLGLLGLLVALLGIVAPIAWDFHKTKNEITVSVIEQAQIISSAQIIDGLHVTYGGQEVRELSRLTLTVKNTGRTPILRRDLVSPLHIDFEASSAPIDVKLVSSQPSDLHPNISFSPGTKQVEVTFDLLNPEDQFSLSVLFKTGAVKVTSGGRITGLPQILIVNHSPFPSSSDSRMSTWIKAVVGPVTIFTALAALIGLGQAVPERRMKKRLSQSAFRLPNFKSRDEALAFIAARFGFVTNDERTKLSLAVATMADVPDFGSVNQGVLLALIQKAVDEATPNLGLALIFLVFTLTGVWYLFF